MTRYDEMKKKLRTIKNVVSYGVLHLRAVGFLNKTTTTTTTNEHADMDFFGNLVSPQTCEVVCSISHFSNRRTTRRRSVLVCSHGMSVFPVTHANERSWPADIAHTQLTYVFLASRRGLQQRPWPFPAARCCSAISGRPPFARSRDGCARMCSDRECLQRGHRIWKRQVRKTSRKHPASARDGSPIQDRVVKKWSLSSFALTADTDHQSAWRLGRKIARQPKVKTHTSLIVPNLQRLQTFSSFFFFSIVSSCC